MKINQLTQNPVGYVARPSQLWDGTFDCDVCAFEKSSIDCARVNCTSTSRDDNCDVYFVKLEDVT